MITVQEPLRETGVVVQPADVEIVIPVYNEEHSLDLCVTRLTAYLRESFPFSWTITIADNASTDGTWALIERLAAEREGVRGIRLAEKGRGRALRAAWSRSASPIVAYMDVDLSTDLAALLPLIAPLRSGHSELAIGSRLASGARVDRGAKRELVSRSYNALLRGLLGVRFTDAQCGFKAVRRDVAHELLPLVEDQEWFFDTELLVLAERNGLRVAEVPVDWVDDPDSRVAVSSTAAQDLRGIWRLAKTFSRGGGVISATALGSARPDPSLPTQIIPFAAVGLMTTVVFAVVFLLLAGPLGIVVADIVALVVATVLNLAANRRLTFARRGPEGMVRHYAAGLAVAAIPLALNLIGLGIATLIAPGSVLAAFIAVMLANLVASVARFSLLRRWVFAPL